MKRQQLILHRTQGEIYRSVIKTKHGRFVYWELTRSNKKFFVKECYYLDRKRNGQYYASPQKQKPRIFDENVVLEVVASQLDRAYYGLDVVNSLTELTTEEFISFKLNEFKHGYKFLIVVGEGNLVNGLPEMITTRLANRIHRKIYLRISYYKDNLGAVEAFYYDRDYTARKRVTPQGLTSVFVEYSKKAIIDMVNSELDCDFTDVIVADNSSINVEDNKAALCGNI